MRTRHAVFQHAADEIDAFVGMVGEILPLIRQAPGEAPETQNQGQQNQTPDRKGEREEGRKGGKGDSIFGFKFRLRDLPSLATIIVWP